MAGLRDVDIEGDVPKPAAAGETVRTKLKELFEVKLHVGRLHAIAHAIIQQGDLVPRNPTVGDERPVYQRDLPDQLVMEATLRILEGRRVWDLARVPDPFVFYGGVMGSIWTAFCAAEKSRREHNQIDPDDQPYDWRTRRPLTPLQLLIAKEEEEQFQQLQADFVLEFDKNTAEGWLARRFLALTQDEVYEVDEQARRLGITIDEVYDLRKRVKRAALRFLARRKR